MTLNENPVFLTQKRLVHRGGVLAAILIAALIGLSLLSGLIAYLIEPTNFSPFGSAQDAGQVFYGWIIGVEIVVLIFGGLSRVSNTLTIERKAGLWDSNRLTPLKPRQIVIGYWFGPPLREFYMSLVLAGIGLVTVLLAKLPITFWFGTQVLIFSMGLFLGLFSVLVGTLSQQPQIGLLLMIILFVSQLFSFAVPKIFFFGFLLPTYGIVNLFIASNPPNNNFRLNDWSSLPNIFGFSVYPLLLTIGLQLLIGAFLWRIVIRKVKYPFQPIMLRREALALFAIFIFFQNGLIWDQWQGKYAATPSSDNQDFLIPFLHIATMALAMVVLAFVSLSPESIRKQILGSGLKKLTEIFSKSSVLTAFVLTAIAGLVLFTQVMRSIAYSWEIYLIAVGNLLSFCLIFSLLLEYCRLRFKRHALGFVALWLFILCVLPLILAVVFQNGSMAKFSLLTPGCIALMNASDHGLDPFFPNKNCLLATVGAHFLIAVLLFIAWRREWQKLLTRAA